MTTERDPRTRIVLSWLREDAHENAEHVLLRALDEVDTTRQRRSWWPARRSPQMNRLVIAVSAAAAVLAVAIIGFDLLSTPTVGPPQSVTPTTAPSPSPQPTRTGPLPPQLLRDGPLAAGTYKALPFPSPNGAMSFTFSVPEGWEGAGPNAVIPAAGTGAPDGAALALLLVTELYRDPCKADTGGPLISGGDTIDDLVLAFDEVTPSYTVGSPVDVTLGGYSGKQFELVMPSDVEFESCERGQYWIWEPGPWAQGPGNRWKVSILDVEGTRVVILAHDYPGTPGSVQGELEDIVRSIVIEP